MKTSKTKMTTYKGDLRELPPLTEKQKAEMEALSAMPDDQIDLCDIPEVSEE